MIGLSVLLLKNQTKILLFLNVEAFIAGWFSNSYTGQLKQ